MLSSIQTNNNPTPISVNFKGVENTNIDLGKNLIPEGESIVYFSDFHSNISKFPKLAGLINYIQAELPDEKIIKICAGDFFLGSVSKNLSKIVKIFNHIKLNFLTLGNHEFDVKPEILKIALNRISATILVSNMRSKNHGLPLKESMIISYNKNPFGVIGATIDLVSKKKDYGQMTFEQTVKVIQDNINKLTQQGIKKILLISHMGFKKDKQLAQQTNGIDIIISSHSHHAINGIKEGINLERSTLNEPVAIFQAAQNNNKLGYARVNFNDNGVLTKIYNKIIPTNLPFIKEDVDIQKIVFGNESFKPIARCIYNYKMDKINFSENAFANWITDSMNSELKNAQVVILPSRMIRACMQKGNITKKEITEILPTVGTRSKESYRILKLSGKRLIDTITDINIIDSKVVTTRIVHTSGLKYRIDKNHNLQDVLINNKKGKYVPIKADQDYNVAIPGYILKTGKFRHLELNKAPIIEETNKTANEILLNSLRNKINIINTKLDGRIIIDDEIQPEFDFSNLPNFVEIKPV